ncbi:MAG: ribosome silencing factor [Spirochaetaceae bacterium]|jgi:ribosome-associated protein|nr:ribosome silencing factor [Spirochaetaceae bacterium]
MDDTQINNGERIADGVTALLAEHRAVDPVKLDLRRFNIWTDFFVVATVTSAAHLEGLKRHLEEWAADNRAALRRESRRRTSGKGTVDTNILWEIIDMGNVIVHLMSKDAREFYALENLWV